MYIDKFDSFIEATTNTKTFVITIEMVDGTALTSSAMPIAMLRDVQTEITEALEARQPISVWNRHHLGLNMVPATMVKTVRFQL